GLLVLERGERYRRKRAVPESQRVCRARAHRYRGARGRAFRRGAMTFVTKRALPRRTFLRAAGATIALPLLDAMLPAFGADAPPWTPRLGFMYVGNGIVHKTFKPAGEGAGFALSPVLVPLASL